MQDQSHPGGWTKPSLAVSAAIFAVAAGVMAWLRLYLFGDRLITLTYGVPLLLCLWHQDRRLLWAMAVTFTGMATVKAFWLMPDLKPGDFSPLTQWVFQVANIVVTVLAVHLAINLTRRIRSSHARLAQANGDLLAREDEITRQNEELQQQTEELQTQSEELARKNEELQQQSEELEQQGEELQAQAEDLRATNAALDQRESMLQTILHSLRDAGGEQQIMQRICQSLLALMGEGASGTAVVELAGENLVVLTHAGLGDLAEPRWPFARSFASIVMQQDRTGYVEDLSARPDLIVPRPGDRVFRSILATPLRLNGKPAGAVEVYSPGPRQWTGEDFRIVEWVAAQCAIITERKRAEQALRQSELHIRRKLESVLSPEGDIGALELGDIIDAGAIQSLMDDFYKVARIPASIIDLKGKMLVGVGWQQICMRFHRVHPETCRHCLESDLQLSAGVRAGQCRLYKCKNHMWDIATPIMVGGHHVGNVFSGQFFFEGEAVDRELFRSQARQYGFDEREYLEALDAVPRLSREAVDAGMGFLTKLAHMLSLLGYSNIKLARSLADRQRSEEQVRKLNRTLTALSSSSQAMARAQDEAGYLQDACRIIVENCGHSMAWIGYAEDDQAQSIRPVACAGLEQGYLQTLRLTWDDSPRGRGPTGTAIRTGRPCMCRNMLTDPAFEPWRQQALQRGYASSIALPLVQDDRAFGALTIYCREPDPFSDDEVKLLSELVGDLAHGIRTMRLRLAQAQAEEAVRQAKESAEAANAAKDQFIAALSHELRTPLTPVLAASSSILADHRLPEDLREELEMIHRNAGLEVALINDLLDVTRIASGKLVLDKRPLDVAQVLREAARICSVDLDGRSQTLTIETPGEPYPMEADAARLHQVFWNLIKNAIKFTPHGGRITVRARKLPVASCQLPEGSGTQSAAASATPSLLTTGNWQLATPSVIVDVIDNGVGIEPHLLPKLFNRFEQGDRNITRQFGGLGLGLTIAKAVVEMHGGAITAHSEGLGRGATFTVRLPIADCQLPIAKPGTPATDQQSQIGNRKLAILLVEDHADTAKLMSRLLSAKGHQVTRADCVQTALTAVQADRFDLLISDLGLPDGTGYDLMRQLIAAGKPLPAIALSGYGTAADIRKSHEAGFAEHLVKPVDFPALHAALLRIPQSPSTPGPVADEPAS